MAMVMAGPGKRWRQRQLRAGRRALGIQSQYPDGYRRVPLAGRDRLPELVPRRGCRREAEKGQEPFLTPRS